MTVFMMPINMGYGNMLLFTEFIAATESRPTPSGAPMTKTSHRLSISIVILCSAFMLKTAHAEQALVPANDQDRFIVQLPNVDREALIAQVEMLRSQLIQRKQVLLDIVAEKKLDSGDALIMILMPGGLLYAGYKKVRYEQAVNELSHVSADIEEFSGDLLAMQSTSVPVAVAQLP
jgi:hypothetical protein